MDSAQNSDLAVEDLRRIVLRLLTREYLGLICYDYNLTVEDRRSYDSYINTILAAGVPMEAILRPLPRDSLKAICEILALDMKGREKETLVERIAEAVKPKKSRSQQKKSPPLAAAQTTFRMVTSPAAV